MSCHPVNLAIRFLLELISIGVIALWGFQHGDGVTRFVFAVAAPIAAGAVWGIFAVPNDPSRSGSAPIPTPGVIRLAIELCFFAAAVYAWVSINRPVLAAIFGLITAIHYGVSYERVRWLIRGTLQ